MNKIFPLYIHIPFCDHICSYCDFYKMIAKEEVIKKYISYLEKELILKEKYLNDVNVIYIGGGTPSSIGIRNLKTIFDTLKKHIKNEIIEFSIECNPKDITDELILLFKKYNINRVSLGIQSLNNDKLKLMRRNHNKKDVIRCLKLFKLYNFKNFNIDLIYGFPNDDFKKIKYDIKKISKYKPTHFSCYSLILEPKTILYKLYNENKFELFNDDEEATLYYQIQKYLNKLGYTQYEISNFSKPNYECVYNLNTWNNLNYLGIGASASYYINNKRYTNVKNLNKYFESIDKKEVALDEEEVIDFETNINEEIILGLRKINGINVSSFNKKFNVNIFDYYKNIKFLLENNLLEFKNNQLKIKDNKLYISNSIINKIIG